MAKSTTVETACLAAVNCLASIVKAGEDLVSRLWPTLPLAGTTRILRESVGHRVFLFNVALKVHVGECPQQVPFAWNEPQVDVGLDKPELNVLVGGSAIKCLDILLDSLLRIVNVFVCGGFFNLLPRFLGRDIGHIVTVDLPGSIAGFLEVTWSVQC